MAAIRVSMDFFVHQKWTLNLDTITPNFKLGFLKIYISGTLNLLISINMTLFNTCTWFLMYRCIFQQGMQWVKSFYVLQYFYSVAMETGYFWKTRGKLCTTQKLFIHCIDPHLLSSTAKHQWFAMNPFWDFVAKRLSNEIGFLALPWQP